MSNEYIAPYWIHVVGAIRCSECNYDLEVLNIDYYHYKSTHEQICWYHKPLTEQQKNYTPKVTYKHNLEKCKPGTHNIVWWELGDCYICTFCKEYSDKYYSTTWFTWEDFPLTDKKGTEVMPVSFIKNDTDKIQPFTYMIPEAIEALTGVLKYGANKYSNDNWRKCEDINRYFDALMRHLLEIKLNGIDSIDSESNLKHTYHVLANAAFIVGLQNTQQST